MVHINSQQRSEGRVYVCVFELLSRNGYSTLRMRIIHRAGARITYYWVGFGTRDWKPCLQNGWRDLRCEFDGIPTGQGGACWRCRGWEDVPVHAVQNWPLCGGHHAQPEGGRVPQEMDHKRKRSFSEFLIVCRWGCDHTNLPQPSCQDVCTNTLIASINLFGEDVIRVLDDVACHLHSGAGAIFFDSHLTKV